MNVMFREHIASMTAAYHEGNPIDSNSLQEYTGSETGLGSQHFPTGGAQRPQTIPANVPRGLESQNLNSNPQQQLPLNPADNANNNLPQLPARPLQLPTQYGQGNAGGGDMLGIYGGYGSNFSYPRSYPTQTSTNLNSGQYGQFEGLSGFISNQSIPPQSQGVFSNGKGNPQNLQNGFGRGDLSSTRGQYEGHEGLGGQFGKNGWPEYDYSRIPTLNREQGQFHRYNQQSHIPGRDWGKG